MFDYYYGAEAEQFVFYRIPKVLFEVEGVKEISTDAKLLYGLMLDRMQLSAKNGWLDEEGRVYIYYTLEQVMENMNCARQKAAKLLDELEKDAGLIERVRTGLNKPNKIYVKNLSTYLRKSYFLKYENQTSGSMKIKLQEVRKSNSNNTDINNTNTSETDISQSIGEDADFDVDSFHKPIKLTMEKPDGLMDGMTLYREYESILKEHLEYEYYVADHPYDKDTLDEIIAIMTDVMVSKSGTVRISGDDKPIEVVKSRFMKMNSFHLEYVLEQLRNNTNKVHNIRAYLLATLYNAPVTMSNYYSALVNHDMYGSD